MKKEFGVGEIAKMLNAARSTVIYWIKKGKLEAYQTPGGDNRVPRKNLIAFMEKQKIPLEYLNDIEKKKVLVVDDNPDILSIFQRAFSYEEDLALALAATGFEAGEMVNEFRPDLIMLDIKLPDMDGRTVCQYIRAKPEQRHTIIYAMSGLITEQEAGDLESQGFDKYFQKSFDIVEVMKEIKAALLKE